ncbi:MFS transporter [uncultured Leifsonia sp.]|uniref:MFS transporter n=1 Tax=uncultured Leifsonia sp. TaxID=340359 RepID=UPI0028D606AC|nr:MFS transporter [uncultured Leifsonia sp.]
MIVGFAGQLAWTVENMYLNVFVYDTLSTDPAVIATMVALSAIAATIATLVAGAWSDRTGRRRALIAGGYIAWGISTAAFGFVGAPGAGAEAGPPPAAAAAIGGVIAIILLDCLMSAIGSSANDAAFMAWVTDSTTPANRGRVDGALAVMPLLGMLVVFGALDGLTRAGDWRLFFGIVGITTTLTGVLSWFLVRDRGIRTSTAEGLLAATVRGLRPSVVRSQPVLYLTLAIWAVVGISSQVFLPYVIIYLERTLRIESYALLLGVVLLLASGLSVLAGRLMDRIGKPRMLAIAVPVFAAGLLGMSVVREFLPVTIAATVMMTGMMTSIAAVSALSRDATPAGRAGGVQGLRMLLAVMVPMVVGPFIGAAVIAGNPEHYVDLGQTLPVPGPGIFLAAALVLVLVGPFAWLRARAARTADAGGGREARR